MYELVLMTMLTAAPDEIGFHRHNHGCQGQASAGCQGHAVHMRHRESSGCQGTHYRHVEHGFSNPGAGCQGGMPQKMPACPPGEPCPVPSAPKLLVPAPGQHSQGDALDELNWQRARAGRYPFIRDDGLTQAALNAASYRASRGIVGHTRGGMGDFRFVPPGAFTMAGGAGVSNGPFTACREDESGWTYAGAASVMGANGLVYHQLFVR